MRKLALCCLVMSAAVGCGSAKIPTSLAAPSNLAASLLGAGVHLMWNSNSMGETEFRIERKTGVGTYFQLATVQTGTTTYHDEPVSAGETYFYRVRAAAGTVTSDPSNEVSILIPGTAGPVSLKSDLVPLFKTYCGTAGTGCHGRDAYAPAPASACRSWLALEDVPLGSKFPTGPMAGQATGCPDLTLHQRLTQLDSWNCNKPLRKYITANSLIQSQVYQVVAGDPTGAGSCEKAPGVLMDRMPLPPAAALSTADQKKIESWIMAGAPNN